MFTIRTLMTILKNSNITRKDYIKKKISNESKEIKHYDKGQFA